MCRLRRRPPTWARPSGHRCASTRAPACDRSEEHTSELQSRPHLVCRLLLEKKKKKSKQQSCLHFVSSLLLHDLDFLHMHVLTFLSGSDADSFIVTLVDVAASTVY